MRVLCKTILIGLLLASPVAAQPAIFVVRHAERADAASGGAPMMAADPELSEAGRARAKALAVLLEDANITAIFTTEFKRTQQTAAPLAKEAGIQSTMIRARDQATLVEALKTATGNVLVVGHSNTVPSIIKDLGVSTPVTLRDDEYDNLFIVIPAPALGERSESKGARLLRLHFR